MYKAIERIICIVGAILMAWLLASWADVVLHNTTVNPIYQPWNFFVLFWRG